MTEPSIAPPPATGGGVPAPRDPVLILIANLIGFGGIGYLLLGRRTKAIVAMVIFCIAGVLTCGWGALVLSAITAVDGYMQAQHVKNGRVIDDTTFFNQSR